MSTFSDYQRRVIAAHEAKTGAAWDASKRVTLTQEQFWRMQRQAYNAGAADAGEVPIGAGDAVNMLRNIFGGKR